MSNAIRRWFASKQGKNTLIVVLSVALVVSVVGQVVGWSSIGRLVAGTIGTWEEGYYCMPTCQENDGRFLLMPGESVASFGGAKIVLWIEAPPGSTSFDLGIFDGDSGKDNAGNLSMADGNWDDTETNTTYTLYADPARDGKGATIVGQWQGNDANPTTDPLSGWWTASAATMPNNAWYDITVQNRAAAQNPNGNYYYRFEATRPVEGSGGNAFKLRSQGPLTSGRAELVDANFALVGQLAAKQDLPIIYPDWTGDFDNPGPTTTYDGSWEFYFEVPPGTETLSLWDGDFDRGTAPSPPEGGDTDDPNTAGIPPWAVPGFTVPERAGGKGAPADDSTWAVYRREPAVYYSLIGPDGATVFVNEEPSGTEEWEEFVVSSDPDKPDSEIDLRVDSVPAGTYTLKIEGLDLHNVVWFRLDYTIGEDPCPACPICPECPAPPECPVEPTETPTPTPEPTSTPTPTPLPEEPEPCDDAQPIDLLYVLDVSGSMSMLYPGSGSKLEAAQRAIMKLNEWVAQQDNGSRVALLTFHGAGRGQGQPPLYPPDVQLVSGFTSDIAAFNTMLQNLRSSGSTPTAHALNQVVSWLPGAWDASHVPVVILVSDGVPTVDLDQHGFQDAHVQNVSLYDSAGNFLSPDAVRALGRNYREYNEKAGEPLADAMLAIQGLMAAVPTAQVHAVAVQAAQEGIFNDDILRYVAAQGNGQFFMAEDTDQLVAAFQWAFIDSACEGASSAPPAPPPCPNLVRRQYRVENTTNDPFYGIKFEFQSGAEIKNGGYDDFEFVLTSQEATAMTSVRMEAKAGRRTGTVTLRNCQFSGAQSCAPVSNRGFTFTFLGATDNGDGTLTLTFRVQNDNSNALSHATFGLTSGVTPSTPLSFYESETCP
jgi:hypothetical protein